MTALADLLEKNQAWADGMCMMRDHYQGVLDRLPTEQDQGDRLCELNVVEQVDHMCQNSIVQDAWKRGQPLTVHGFIYDVADGLLRDLGLSISSDQEYTRVRQKCVGELVLRPVRSGRPAQPCGSPETAMRWRPWNGTGN